MTEVIIKSSRLEVRVPVQFGMAKYQSEERDMLETASRVATNQFIKANDALNNRDLGSLEKEG